jgi:hypothetical protein
MMSDMLDWTQRLGDAVLAQEQDVMAAVQRLRQQAQNARTLKSTEQQNVTIESQAIVILPANPQVVYVPTYDPTVVYGTWPYPAYPPVYYPPPPAYYPYGSALAAGIGFAAGVAAKGFDPDEPYAPKRVIRGGSFLCSEIFCFSYRPAARMKLSLDSGLPNVGFRLVMAP